MSYTHENLSLHGKHEPEYSLEPGPDGNKERVELPGHYTIGVEVEGAFVPLARFPAGRLFKDIRLAKQTGPKAGEQTGEQSQQSGTEQPPSPSG